MSELFDDELRRELSRVDAPPGFTDRVMKRIPASLPESHRFRAAWIPAIAAGVALLVTPLGIERYRHERMIRAERTQQQVVYALQLTAEKLNHVNARLQRSAPEVRILLREQQSL